MGGSAYIIIFVTVGLVLLSIPGVRDIGVTLVASAGLAGLAVGAAAQPALKSLIAGVQMALTEPINIDDVVIVEGLPGNALDPSASGIGTTSRMGLDATRGPDFHGTRALISAAAQARAAALLGGR